MIEPMSSQPIPAQRATSLARLIFLFFFHGLGSGLWILPFGNTLAVQGLEGLIPIVYAFPAIANIISPLLVGTLADYRISVNRLLFLLLLLCSLLMFLSYQALTHHYTTLFLLTMGTHALLSAPVTSLITTLGLAHLPNPSTQFPLLKIFSSLSWIVSGFTLSFLIHSDASPRSLLASAVIKLVLAFFIFLLPPTPPLEKQSSKKCWKEIFGFKETFQSQNREIGLYLLTLAMVLSLSSAYFPYAPQQLKAMGITRPSAWMTLSQWSEILTIGTLGFVISRIPIKTVFLIGIICSVLRCFLFTLAALGAGMIPMTIGILLHGPIVVFAFMALQIYIQKNLPNNLRARSQAFVNLFGLGIGGVTGMIISGLLAKYILNPSQGTLPSWALFWGILGSLDLLILLFLLKKTASTAAHSPS